MKGAGEEDVGDGRSANGVPTAARACGVLACRGSELVRVVRIEGVVCGELEGRRKVASIAS